MTRYGLYRYEGILRALVNRSDDLQALILYAEEHTSGIIFFEIRENGKLIWTNSKEKVNE